MVRMSMSSVRSAADTTKNAVVRIALVVLTAAPAIFVVFRGGSSIDGKHREGVGGGGVSLLISTTTTERSKLLSTIPLVSSLYSPAPLRRGSATVDSSGGGIEIGYLWQAPPPESPKSVEGVLLVAHGCNHKMTDWWPPSPDVCPDCIGLPEERAIVNIAHHFGLIVVALSSQDRCWRQDPDASRVVATLEYLYKNDLQHYRTKTLTSEHGTDNKYGEEKNNGGNALPLFAFGASSGGNLVSSILPFAVKEEEKQKMQGLRFQLVGYISEIMAPPSPHSKIFDMELPCVYITMNGDERTDRNAHDVVTFLQLQQLTKALHIRLPPIPLLDDFFAVRTHQRIPADVSTQMVQALVEANIVHPQTRLLLNNPRHHQAATNDWKSVLQPFISQVNETLEEYQSGIAELMNVAYNHHEMTRDGVAEAIEFLLDVHKSNKEQQKK